VLPAAREWGGPPGPRRTPPSGCGSGGGSSRRHGPRTASPDRARVGRPPGPRRTPPSGCRKRRRVLSPARSPAPPHQTAREWGGPLARAGRPRPAAEAEAGPLARHGPPHHLTRPLPELLAEPGQARASQVFLLLRSLPIHYYPLPFPTWDFSLLCYAVFVSTRVSHPACSQATAPWKTLPKWLTRLQDASRCCRRPPQLRRRKRGGWPR
jgi:hypothetical protein